MAAKTATEALDERIVDIDVADEMRASFLEYAYSVIYSRALPDARDGLKPVQRRILFQMAEMGLRPDRGHVKSARVVGEVMGKLHPHGDSAIYDALVRMSQSFALRLPLIDGHGNFGSLDDGPAAMRYTECRLAPAALALTSSLDEDVVDFTSNYDGRESEPVVLPAAFPALLVNGASGIAVGMATNLAPHNVGEICAAAKLLLRRPQVRLDEIMRLVPGPDMPTGGQIIGLSGIREAYATGRGAFRIRATTRIEQISPRRKGIVVTELPFTVGPERVTEKIKELVTNKKLTGIADLADLTDGDSGLNFVIEIKSGYSPEALREELFRLTPLEETFHINNVALVEGQPRTLGLIDMLRVFVDHRLEIVRRRSEFRRTKATDRLHLIEGLLVAVLDIDRVVALIRASDDTTSAKSKLIATFTLSDLQATHILDMPLRRLTKFSRIELETEQGDLAQTIAELTRILAEPKVLHKVVADELDEVAAKHATPRRSVLLDSAPVVARPTPPPATGPATGPALAPATAPLEVEDVVCRVALTARGELVRIDDEPGNERPLSGAVICSAVGTTSRSDIGVVTSAGRIHRVNAVDLPNASAQRVSGPPVSQYCTLEKGERAIGLVTLDDHQPILALGTANGTVKRVIPDVPTGKSVWEIISLHGDDEVVGVNAAADGRDLVFITSDAALLHFKAATVRPQGRAAGGVAGIKLGPDAHVIFFGALDPSPANVVVTVAGSLGQLRGTGASSVKVSALSEFPAKGRATGGVRCQRLVKGEDALLLGWAGGEPAQAETSGGRALQLPNQRAKRDASGTKLATAIAALGGDGL